MFQIHAALYCRVLKCFCFCVWLMFIFDRPVYEYLFLKQNVTFLLALKPQDNPPQLWIRIQFRPQFFFFFRFFLVVLMFTIIIFRFDYILWLYIMTIYYDKKVKCCEWKLEIKKISKRKISRARKNYIIKLKTCIT